MIRYSMDVSFEKIIIRLNGSSGLYRLNLFGRTDDVAFVFELAVDAMQYTIVYEMNATERKTATEGGSGLNRWKSAVKRHIF